MHTTHLTFRSHVIRKTKLANLKYKNLVKIVENSLLSNLT